MSGVLLLNADYRPLTIVSLSRAVGLIFNNKAQIVEASDRMLRSVSWSVQEPLVIALRYYVNVPRRGIHWSKRGVLLRDDFTCGYCGIRPGDRRGKDIIGRKDFTVDHIIPLVQGGGNTWTNTVTACKWCNQRKGGRTNVQAGMKLLLNPRRPRTNYIVLKIKHGPEVWRKYVRV